MKYLSSLLLVAVAACAALGPASMVPVEQAGDATELVCDEHDAYVLADEALSDDSEAAFLAESALLRGMVQGPAEFVDPDAYEAAFEPVAGRYDAYVDSDPSLLPQQKVSYKRTTELLRNLIAEARD